jgi:TPR repeat protein
MHLATRPWIIATLVGIVAATSSFAEATKLTYKERLDRGDPEAQFVEGALKDNAEEAFEWFRKSAEQGYAPAQASLGYSYYSGKGTIKDYVKAVSWLRKADEQDNADAQYLLGSCYYYGNGVQTDLVKAMTFFRKAAEKGHKAGQFRIGCCLERGDGTPKDFIEATAWYRKAAEQGLAEAQYNLGNCYADGKGVPKDKIEAYAYHNLAGVTIEAAKISLSRLETEMTQDQVAAGQKRTKELKEEISKRMGSK